MKLKVYLKVLLLSFILLILNERGLFAQGDGPRSYLLAPKGVLGVNPKWLNLSQNFLPGSNLLVESANLRVNVFPITLFYNFNAWGNLMQAQFMLNPGSATGSLTSDANLPYNNVSASGFSDGFAAIKAGLIGAPALNLLEFAKHRPSFSMFAYFRLWYSGTYDASKPLNLGTNRLTYEFGFPLAIPVFVSKKTPLWIENYSFIQFYGTNDDPSIITQGSSTHQLPLFVSENHATYNFTKKFWGGIDLRYQYGGAVEVDGVTQDNKINLLGGGISAGYQIFPFLGSSVSYGMIITGDNDAKTDMLRLSLVLVYASTKNLKK